MTTLSRRFFLRGLIAAPAVVAVSSLMPIRGIVMPTAEETFAVNLGFGYGERQLTRKHLLEVMEIMRECNIPPMSRMGEEFYAAVVSRHHDERALQEAAVAGIKFVRWPS